MIEDKAINDTEAARLDALRRTRLLDSEPEETYDHYVAVAAALMNVPTALVSLVDSDRQWFKAKVGLEADETSRDIAFCAHAILGDGVLLVPNATADPRFRDNPLVTGEPHIRFYCGAPIVLSTGERLGTLCTIGYEPRQVTDAQINGLKSLTKILAREIETGRLGRYASSRADQLESQRDWARSQAETARLVAQEMNHRMGNLFAQVTALVSMADRENDNRADMVAAVRQRIVALKSVSDLLMNEDWTGASLHAVAGAALAPLADAREEGRIVIEGPDLQLNDKSALHLALVLGELGANALRHGALTVEGGLVRLAWTVESDDLELTWTEEGLEGVTAPTRQGFGSTLLSRVAPAGLMGTAQTAFEATGIHYRLTANLDQIQRPTVGPTPQGTATLP